MGFSIPTMIANYRVYDSLSQELLGVADVQLPNIQRMSATLSGAGIMGEIEMPSAMEFQAMSMTINWRQPTAAAFRLLASTQHKLDLRAAVQWEDPALGSAIPRTLRVEVTGKSKGMDLGTAKVSSPSEGSTEIEVLRLAVWENGALMVEIDKLAYIYRAPTPAGAIFDYSQAYRVAMGTI